MDYIENTDTEEKEVDKNEKFKEITGKRMSMIHDQLMQLKKISGKRSVDFTEENVEKMFAYLENDLAECKEAFMQRFNGKKTFDFEF